MCSRWKFFARHIHREIAEELGIDLSKYNETLYKEVKTSEAFLDFYLYNIDIEILNLKFNDNEVEEAKWVDIDEYEKLISEGKIACYQEFNVDYYKKCIDILFKN